MAAFFLDVKEISQESYLLEEEVICLLISIILVGTAKYDDERNPKLYLVKSEVPRVKSYLGLTKTSSERESAVCTTCTV